MISLQNIKYNKYNSVWFYRAKGTG